MRTCAAELNLTDSRGAMILTDNAAAAAGHRGFLLALLRLNQATLLDSPDSHSGQRRRRRRSSILRLFLSPPSSPSPAELSQSVSPSLSPLS